MRESKGAFVLVCVACGMLTLMGCGQGSPTPQPGGGSGSGPKAEAPSAKPMPAFTVKEWVTDKRVNPEELKGKPYVVEFWATWCPPCRQSIPHLNKLAKEYEPKGLKIIGLTTEPVSEAKAIKAFAKKMKMAYYVGFNKELANKLGVTGIPHAVVVDAKGMIAWQGHPMEKGFEAAIKKVLKAG